MSSTTIDSFNLRLSNVRTEQATDANGYSVFLSSTTNDLKGIYLENCYFDLNRNGLYLRRPETISIENCFFAASTGYTNLNITFQSRTELNTQNVFVNAGSTVTMLYAVALEENLIISLSLILTLALMFPTPAFAQGITIEDGEGG